MSEDLLRCKICGSLPQLKKVHFSFHLPATEEEGEDEYTQFTIFCGWEGCTNSTHVFNTMKGALEAWNSLNGIYIASCFCGNEPEIVTDGAVDKKDRKYRVVCTNCNEDCWEGPIKQNRLEAVEAWNKVLKKVDDAED